MMVAARKKPGDLSRRRPFVAAGMCFAAAAALGLARPWASAESAPRTPANTETRDVPRYVDGVLKYSDSYAARIGLTTEEATFRAIAPTTEVTGELDFSPSHVAAVGARIFGHVRDVHVVPGEQVAKGAALAELESTALGQAQAELRSAKAREDFAASEARRKRMLAQEGIAAHRSLEVAQSELRAATAHRQAAEQTVRSMSGRRSAKAALGRFVLRAPIDGEITEVNVYRGQAVQPDHVAFRVADMRHLWLELAVYERDLPNVRTGDAVYVRPHGDDEVVVQGRVEHVGSVVDPTTRTATVRVRVDNDERVLRVGQAARASIVSVGAQLRALAVPRDSVVLVDGEPTVFVSPADGEVVPRAVEVGLRGETHVEIRQGLHAGERVVTDGVFALKSELFR